MQNILCVKEGMAESIYCAPAKLTWAEKRHFQTFKKAYHEQWSYVSRDERSDTCMNSEVFSTAVK